MAQLTENFTLEEMTASETAQRHYILNRPTQAAKDNLLYLCQHVLQPAREALGEPIEITSGYRCARLNKLVGGVAQSQHTLGLAADIRIKNPTYANRLVNILSRCEYVDQLLYERVSGGAWLHVSTCVDRKPRHDIRLNYQPK